MNELRDLGGELQVMQAKVGMWKRPIKSGLTEETSFAFLCPTSIIIRGNISNTHILSGYSCIKTSSGIPLDRMKSKALWHKVQAHTGQTVQHGH